MPTNAGDTFAPSDAPTNGPSNAPSSMPSGAPTTSPSDAPTPLPSNDPSAVPTNAPTLAPPTLGPSDSPTREPTSESPTGSPTSLGPTHTPTTTTEPTRTPTSYSTIFGGPTLGPTTAPTILEVTVSQQVNLADMDVDQVDAAGLTLALETMAMDTAVSAGMNFSSVSVVITSVLQSTGSSEIELIQDSAPDAVLMESRTSGTSVAYKTKFTGYLESSASQTDLTQLTTKLDSRVSRSDSSGLCSHMAAACVSTSCASCTTSSVELSAVLITSAPTGAPTNLGEGSSSSGLSSTQWGWLGAGIIIWACVIGLVVVLLVLNCRSGTQEQIQGSASEPLMSRDPVNILPRTSYDQLDTPAEDTEEQL